MTAEALNKFRASKGWEAGVDGNGAFRATPLISWNPDAPS
jgi:hypothetical protein